MDWTSSFPQPIIEVRPFGESSTSDAYLVGIAMSHRWKARMVAHFPTNTVRGKIPRIPGRINGAVRALGCITSGRPAPQYP